jgi:type IV pilus secretin PilQ/predicted competence protein
MKNQKQTKHPAMWMLCALLCSVCAITFAQRPSMPRLGEPLGMPVTEAASDYVSIKVDGGTLTQVLNAFAIQTGRNVVVGPEVVSDGVNIHLNHVRWDDALEVILKPYGFGYRTVGDTIVISKLDKLAALEAVEPLQTRVFNLKFVDAGDVKEMLTGQLSGRGSMSVMVARGQKGWDFAAQNQSRYSQSASSLAKRERMGTKDEDVQAKSKTIVVTDIPGVLEKIAGVLEIVDQKPQQILVEAKFVEVNDNYLRDIGVELGGSFKMGGNPLGASEKFFDAVPNAFDPASGKDEIAGERTLNTFGQITFDSGSANLLINLLQEDDDSKVLSAPKVLTLNNQEATIIVGQKYPIIESNVSGGSTDNNSTSTTLDYYENIGIQLNVVPQVSGEGYINMIVHPSVSSIIDFTSGIVVAGGDSQALTEYPVINIREAETQILMKDTETIVIGGLLEERKGTTTFKVPFLGDLPLIGRLFRRDTDNTKNIDLLIFITASMVDIDQPDSPVAPPKEEEAVVEPVPPEEPVAADVVMEETM